MVSRYSVVWCDDPARHFSITHRQSDVAYVLMQGYRVGEIAERLNLSTGTARMHVKNLHVRLGTRNLHSLALWCWEHRECCLRNSPHELLPADELPVNIATRVPTVASVG